MSEKIRTEEKSVKWEERANQAMRANQAARAYQEERANHEERAHLANVAEALYSEYKDAYSEKALHEQTTRSLTVESLAEYNARMLFESKKAYQKRMGEAAANIIASSTDAAVKAEEAIARNLEQGKVFTQFNLDSLRQTAHGQAHKDGVWVTDHAIHKTESRD